MKILFSFDFNIYLLRSAVYSTIITYFIKSYKSSFLHIFNFSSKSSLLLGYGIEKNLQYPDRHLASLFVSYNKFFKSGYGSFELRYIRSLKDTSDLFIVSYLPIYRYNFNKIFLEYGVGISFMNKIKIENRNKSTYFQFNDNIGIGYKFKNFNLFYRFTHLSNLNIKKPNPSIDLHQIYFEFNFR